MRNIAIVTVVACILFVRPNDLFGRMTAEPPDSQQSTSAAVQHEGQVGFYEPGKKLAITVRPQVEVTYDLSDPKKAYKIPPDLKVGDNVVSSEQEQDHGPTIVTVTIKPKH